MGQMVRHLEETQHRGADPAGGVPAWVPRSVQNYIDHTEKGVPIRALARKQGCHASTIMRQIRRIETLRDDPLVDGVLKTLGGKAGSRAVTAGPARVAAIGFGPAAGGPVLPDGQQLATEGLRVLRRLCETGAVLAVAADMEKAVIVRDAPGGESTRTGVVDRTVAEAMALKGWIAASVAGRITRYHITAAGRSALADLMARDESGHAKGAAEPDGEDTGPRRIRYSLAESPLVVLARRRDSDGAPFLDSGLVHAGERLREDFEMAQMQAQIARGWEEFLAALPQERPLPVPLGPAAVQRAHGRVIAALRDLGPGLSDVALRCCCFLEGLETAEKTLGWSARSGKIVLRIALMRLKRHYADSAQAGGQMIG